MKANHKMLTKSSPQRMTHRVRDGSSTLCVIAGFMAYAVAAVAYAAPPGMTREGAVTVMTFPDVRVQLVSDPIDYVNAQPLPLPVATNFSPAVAQSEMIEALSAPVSASAVAATPGFSGGSVGDGKTRPVFLGKPAPALDAIAPQEFGTTKHPFSTARADGYSGATNKTYPFRAAGRLFFGIAGATYVCSGSLIKKGIVLTAAHCVSSFGDNIIYRDFRFVPGYKKGVGPYGNWTAKQVRVLTSYLNGSDVCAQSGVICRNDVALIVLNPQSGALPGTNTGWYGFLFNGQGFTSNKLTHVTQIGYPVCLDNGEVMERNDSQGFVSTAYANNTLIGSLMCGGASGGPWIVNFGKRPRLTGTTNGSFAEPNMVVGVTSWGSTNTGPKQVGASPFLNTNIQNMVNAACTANPGNC